MRAVILDEKDGHWLLRSMLSELKYAIKDPSPETLSAFRKQYRTAEMWVEGHGFVVPEEYKTWNRPEFEGIEP